MSRPDMTRWEWVGAARNRAKTHCPHGHPDDEANTRRYAGRRSGKACAKARLARWRAERKERNAA